jgi:hypothetical protein
MEACMQHDGTSDLIEIENRRILGKWLGLTDESSDTFATKHTDSKSAAGQSMLKNLDRLREPPPAIEAKTRFILNSVWEKLDARLNAPSFSDKVINVVKNFIQPKILVPALSALIIGIVFFTRTSGDGEKIDLALGAKKINIAKEPYFSPSGQLVSATIGSVTLQMTDVKELRATSDAEGLKVSFAQGKIFVSYPKTAERKKLNFADGNASYEVTGTQFLIESTGLNDALYVKEGEVKVSAKSVAKKVPAGNIWKSSTPETVTADSLVAQQKIDEFQNTGEKNNTAEKTEKPKTLKEEKDEIAVKYAHIPSAERKKIIFDGDNVDRITLRDGNVMLGKIVDQNETSLRIFTAVGLVSVEKNGIEALEKVATSRVSH